MRYLSNTLRFITALAGCLVIFCLVTMKWLTATFGKNINIDQILFHLIAPTTGVSSNIVISALLFFLVFAAGGVWVFIVYRTDCFIRMLVLLPDIFIKWHKLASRKHGISHNKKILFIVSLFIISLIAGYIVLKKADKKFRIKEYIAAQQTIPEKDFFAEHYQVPPVHGITFDKKKNLVIVLAESMENSFSDSRLGTSYTPHLDSFRRKSSYHPNQVQSLAGWTIGAITAWHFGIPLKLLINGNTYSSKFGHKTFLPNALSIFDILAENGYKQVLLMGTNKKFSGMDNLHKHGQFTIKDYSYWEKSGYDRDKYKEIAGKWGYNDAFVLSRAAEEYQRLSEKEQPFVLIIETIDTHAPNGFCPENKKIYHDIRDAILHTDRELGIFLEKNFPEKPQNTVVAVLGDHYFMGSPDFLSTVKERRVFNAFYGNIPPISQKKQSEKSSAMDIAPTLLEAAGAKWGSSRFGLGTSLFSDEPSLISIYGEDQLHYQLLQRSPFYEKFY